MGDVISSHLDEAKREIITAQTGEVMGKFGHLYEQQYAVALFNDVRFDIEGGGSPQPQLLHRKIPLENKSIFSGSLFQYLDENKKWRNRFFFVPDSYNISYYDNKAAHDKHLHPKGTINCAGYKVLTSIEQYMDLMSNCLPGVKAKLGSSPFLKCATQFPLILWHPYARHFYFCVATEKEQQKWHAVLLDCVRHANDGLSEENKIQTPAFTDAVRFYRQAQGHYGTWEMMCGEPSQILSNLVMEGLLPVLRDLISPRLKGKLHDRQRNWMLISDAVYSLVQGQCQAQYEAVLQKCEAARSSLEASIRTDMDQIITSKEHITNKIRAVVLHKSEKLLKVSIQPYISSILDALMEPTSRGFAEVRDVFFRELVDMSKNTLNDGSKEALAQHMEKISMLAFHPVKMQSCYEKVEQLSLEGLQQRFDVSSPSVFVQRAQILMREQMDDAVYTFEQILHQSLESQTTEELCKTIQRCQDRVIKKFDYDSSTVRKRFFREALLQIFIPYMLKQLSPTCAPELPRFQELIFEDFSRFILVENIFEEVVLHSVMKDIMMAVKEAAVQRRHNLYRDSIVLSNSDPTLHLLGENPSIDWAGEYGGTQEEVDGTGEDAEGDAEGQAEVSNKRRRVKQVVSMIQIEGSPALPGESCIEVPGVNDILEEDGEEEEEEDGDEEENSDVKASSDQNESTSPKASESAPDSSVSKEEEAKPEVQGREDILTESATAIEEKGEDSQQPPSNQEVSEEALPPLPPSKEIPSEATEMSSESASEATSVLPPPPHNDSGFQSPSSEGTEEEEEVVPQPLKEDPEMREEVVPPTAEEHPEVRKEVVPPPTEEQPEVREEVVPPPTEEHPEVREEVVPAPTEEHPEVREEVVPAPTEEHSEVRKEVVPPPVGEQPEVREEVVPAPTEEHPEVREEVVPAPTEEHPEVREEVVPAPTEEHSEVRKEVVPAPTEEHPEVREEVVPPPVEEQPEVRKEVVPAPTEEHPEVVPLPTEEHPEVREEVVPPPTEEHPEVKDEVVPPPTEEHPKVKDEVVPPPTEEHPEVVPLPTEEHPEVREESVAAAQEEATKTNDSETKDQ